MKFLKPMMFSVAIALTCSAPAWAGAGHEHGAKHGGIVAEAKEVDGELVVKPDSLTLYLNHHGKPVTTQGAQAEATLYAGGGKSQVKLEPAGDNKLAAKGSFKTGVGVRVSVAVTLPGKPVEKLNFSLK